MLDDKAFLPQDVVSPNGPVTPDSAAALFAGCGDLVRRDVSAGGTAIQVCVLWLDGTVSGADAAEQVLRPLTDPVRFARCRTAADVERQLALGFAYGADCRRVTKLRELAEAVSYGSCAVVLQGCAFLYQLRTDQHRAVQEPSVEKTVKGGKDAFVESLRVNTALVRSRLRTPRLRLVQTTVGGTSRTPAAVLWLEGAADPALPAELLRRLGAVGCDGAVRAEVFDSGLADCPLSPFPQVMHTERPDRLAAALLEGRAAVLAEGIPVAFAVPATLASFMTAGEDGAQHFLAASCIRLLRWAAFVITLLAPALYIAIAVFHPEMIPTELLLSVIESKQSVPFSTTAEVLGMLLAFELIQEAGLRLPDPVGQTVSIIGALIVGQSAVEARVISPIAVIVVALTGIAGYTMPSQDMSTALRLCRFCLALAAALAGMFGVIAGSALIIWHLCSLESFGRPYAGSVGEALFCRPPRARGGGGA